MKLHIFLAHLAMIVGIIAQGVTQQIAPEGGLPDNCVGTRNGKFQISISPLVAPDKKRDLDLQARGTCDAEGILTLELNNTVLTDSHSRTGYIASNYQFQFDQPPQSGAIYTAGFSICQNGSLAFGPSTIFWRCRSGTFWNLYDRWFAEQCEPAEVVVLPCVENPTPSADQGSVVGTQVVTTTIVSPLADGQPQVVTTTTAILICQIGDGRFLVPFSACHHVMRHIRLTRNRPNSGAHNALRSRCDHPDGHVHRPARFSRPRWANSSHWGGFAYHVDRSADNHLRSCWSTDQRSASWRRQPYSGSCGEWWGGSNRTCGWRGNGILGLLSWGKPKELVMGNVLLLNLRLVLFSMGLMGPGSTPAGSYRGVLGSQKSHRWSQQHVIP
ncbi:uncharacterized protein B0T15DRAFT_281688 [Chaetomium strumarium]|uniref:Cell wall mannoprotein PIR1-like C-terminal domain-containing protein n=1 Tax=Chaetomium strumarium TaxID=1170767 RepID=A0AAJ0LZR5_9PEZI|nr:hypothetical protein B0T15DRAFT_281688 [Chaetomium strumarium]